MPFTIRELMDLEPSGKTIFVKQSPDVSWPGTQQRRGSKYLLRRYFDPLFTRQPSSGGTKKPSCQRVASISSSGICKNLTCVPGLQRRAVPPLPILVATLATSQWVSLIHSPPKLMSKQSQMKRLSFCYAFLTGPRRSSSLPILSGCTESSIWEGQGRFQLPSLVHLVAAALESGHATANPFHCPGRCAHRVRPRATSDRLSFTDSVYLHIGDHRGSNGLHLQHITE